MDTTWTHSGTINKMWQSFTLRDAYIHRPGSYFDVPIRPHLVSKWPHIDLKSTTCIQNDLTRLGKKTTDFRFPVDFWHDALIFKDQIYVFHSCFQVTKLTAQIREMMSHVESLID